MLRKEINIQPVSNYRTMIAWCTREATSKKKKKQTKRKKRIRKKNRLSDFWSVNTLELPLEISSKKRQFKWNRKISRFSDKVKWKNCPDADEIISLILSVLCTPNSWLLLFGHINVLFANASCTVNYGPSFSRDLWRPSVKCAGFKSLGKTRILDR